MDIANDSRLSFHQDKKARTLPDEDDIQDLISWNNLVYTMPVTNSVVASRNQKCYRASNPVYTVNDNSTSSNIIFTIQSGNQFIDWKKSTLNFTLAPTYSWNPKQGHKFSGTILNYGSGSVCNLFRGIIVQSRSGTELLRIDEFGRYRALYDRMTRDRDWFDSVGDSIDYCQPLRGESMNASYVPEINPPRVTAPFYTDPLDQKQADALVGDGTVAQLVEYAPRSYAIPMYLFGGLFESDQLCPSMLASGLRIELILEAPNIAFMGSNEVAFDRYHIHSYKIEEASICCDTHLLNDAASRQLTETSANNGLEVTYTQIFHQKASSQLGDTELILSRAVSRALHAFGGKFVNRAYTAEKNKLLATDFYILYEIPVKQQWRLGSQYYPHQSMKHLADQYMNILYSTEQMSNKKAPCFSRWQYHELHPAIMATFERSSLLNYSGMAVNNSRTLSTSVTWSNSVNTDVVAPHMTYELSVWLVHVSVAKAFLNNIIVSI